MESYNSNQPAAASDSKTMLVVIMAIVGVLVGGGIGYMIGNGSKADESANSAPAPRVQPTTDTKAASLRVALNSLEAQHVDLAAAATRAGFDGSPMFAASAEALDKNSRALADAVASVYGQEAGDQFYTIWASHIGFFVDYTVAAKGGDQAGMDKAVQDLNVYVGQVSELLGGATGLPPEAVAALVSEHVGLLKETVDKHGAEDFAGSYVAQQATRDQITSQIADTLAGAIVKQNPDKFTD